MSKVRDDSARRAPIEASLIWVVGNLVLPLIPLFAVWISVRLVRSRASITDVLGDGVLFFYSASVCAIVLMDLWQARLVDSPAQRFSASCAFVFALILLVIASGAYFLTALARTGVVDADGHALNLRDLSHLSWQVASGVALFTLVARSFISGS